MKSLIATLAQTIAYIGIAPLFPMIALAWMFSLLVAESSNEEPMNGGQIDGFRVALVHTAA